MSKKIFSDRKKYRIVEIAIIVLIGLLTPAIWIIGMSVFQLQTDAILILQLSTIITAAVLFFLFKHWAKAEDERVFLFSQKAARKTIYFFGVTLVVLCVLSVWISNKNAESMPAEPPFNIVFINHTNMTLPFQNSSTLYIVNASDTMIPGENGTNSTGFIYNPYPSNTLIFEIWPNILSVSYPGTSPNEVTRATAQFYGDVAMTLLFVAIALWLTYLIFYYYYGRKYGEFGRSNEE